MCAPINVVWMPVLRPFHTAAVSLPNFLIFHFHRPLRPRENVENLENSELMAPKNLKLPYFFQDLIRRNLEVGSKSPFYNDPCAFRHFSGRISRAERCSAGVSMTSSFSSLQRGSRSTDDTHDFVHGIPWHTGGIREHERVGDIAPPRDKSSRKILFQYRSQPPCVVSRPYHIPTFLLAPPPASPNASCGPCAFAFCTASTIRVNAPCACEPELTRHTSRSGCTSHSRSRSNTTNSEGARHPPQSWTWSIRRSYSRSKEGSRGSRKKHRPRCRHSSCRCSTRMTGGFTCSHVGPTTYRYGTMLQNRSPRVCILLLYCLMHRYQEVILRGSRFGAGFRRAPSAGPTTFRFSTTRQKRPHFCS